jgi:hypothetical protein
VAARRDRNQVGGAVLAVGLGIAYLVVSLPGALDVLARHGWGWLAGPAAVGAWLDGLLPGFGLLAWFIVGGLVVFTVAMVMLCVRHGKHRLARQSLAALLLSVVVLHVLSWVGAGVWYALRFFGFLLAWLASLIPHPGGTVAWVIFWVVMSVLCLLWLWAVWMSFRHDWRFTVVNLVIGVVRGVLPVLFLLLAPVIRVVEHYLAMVVIGVAVLAGIATLGQLLVDQVRSSLLAGRGDLGTLMGAIGVGTAVAALLLESDGFGNYGLLPPPVAGWARTWLLGAGPPTLDAAVALLVIVLCLVGLAGNVRAMRTPPDFEEFRTSLIYTLIGLLAAGGLAALATSARLRDQHR